MGATAADGKTVVAAFAFSCIVGAIACATYSLKARSTRGFATALALTVALVAVACYTLARTMAFEAASENLAKMQRANAREPAACPPFHRLASNGACARVSDDVSVTREGHSYTLAADVFDGVAERERGRPTRAACCKANAVPHDALNVTCAASRLLGCAGDAS